uniref:Uncharacterized protein n=1 Tax=Peronospora matthiolae TaxID=2874970 RepID=A0AAV1V180_9STRA
MNSEDAATRAAKRKHATWASASCYAGSRALAAVQAHAVVHDAPKGRAAFTPARPSSVYLRDPLSSRKCHAPSVVM